MERIVAYCGIICSGCPIFKATKTNDDAERRRVVELLTKQYGIECKAEDINCDGCLTEGPRIFRYCNLCKIRQCARERNVENCAYCEEYACEKLSRHFNKGEPGKEVLDEIRASAKKHD